MKWVFCFVLLLQIVYLNAQTDTVSWSSEIMAWQEEMNMDFSDSLHSPLKTENLQSFTGLDFFDPDSVFCVKARMELTNDSEAFSMKTNTERTPMYRRYGYLHFVIKGEKYKLSAYQRIEFLTTDDYADYLFLPFTDLSNENESYKGGRYLDVRISINKNYVIDFNKAYNPYCAYNNKYSCPVPPGENNLNCKIEAGVKKYNH